MASNINSAMPAFGNATTASVRQNFATAKAEIETVQMQSGYADYNDTATVTTPISVSASTWTKMTNNGLGTNTQVHLPQGVSALWNPVTNQLALSELPLFSMLEFRADIDVTTTSANQVVKAELAMAIGDPIAFSLPLNEMTFKVAGLHRVLAPLPFYIGSAAVKNNPGEFRIWSDAACTVKVYGWYIRAIKYLGA